VSPLRLWVEAGADLFGKFGARLSQYKAIFHTYPLQGLPIFFWLAIQQLQILLPLGPSGDLGYLKFSFRFHAFESFFV
jgi:hypothetical protein